MSDFPRIDELDGEALAQEINRLTKLSKVRELTSEESAYRELLRERFIKNLKEGLRTQLRTIKIVDEGGNDVTPQKLKDEKKKG